MVVDISGVKIPVADDAYFARAVAPKKAAEDQFFEQASKVRKEGSFDPRSLCDWTVGHAKIVRCGPSYEHNGAHGHT